MLRYLPFLLVLAVWIYAFIDCLNTPEKEVRKLPKVVWVIVILLFGQVLIGPLAWFIVGRPRRNLPYGAAEPGERRWVAPDDNPDFLKSLGQGDSQPTGQEPQSQPEPESGSAAESGAEPAPEPSRREARAGEEAAGGTGGTGGTDGDAHLEKWEADLRRREEELRRRENGKSSGAEDHPPQSGEDR